MGGSWQFKFGPKIVRKKTIVYIVFMSLLTVAHQRGSGEFMRFTESHGGGGGGDGDGEYGYGHDDGRGGGGQDTRVGLIKEEKSITGRL